MKHVPKNPFSPIPFHSIYTKEYGDRLHRRILVIERGYQGRSNDARLTQPADYCWFGCEDASEVYYSGETSEDNHLMSLPLNLRKFKQLFCFLCLAIENLKLAKQRICIM